MPKEMWTAFCSYPDSPRGVYEEEVDIKATSLAEARKKAQKLLEEQYDEDLYIRKIICRGPGWYL